MNVNDASRIVIEDSRVMLQIVASLTDNSRCIIYYCNMFIVQAASVVAKLLEYFVIELKLHQINQDTDEKHKNITTFYNQYLIRNYP
jgi:hypothetical protein